MSYSSQWLPHRNRGIKLSPSTPWKHIGKLEVQTGSFLTSALDRSDWATSRPGRLSPGTLGHQRVSLHIIPELSRPEVGHYTHWSVTGERKVKRNKGNRKMERWQRSKDEMYYRSNTGLQNKTIQRRGFGCDAHQRHRTHWRLLMIFLSPYSKNDEVLRKTRLRLLLFRYPPTHCSLSSSLSTPRPRCWQLC